MYQLGLTEDAFWWMTPRKYFALLTQHKLSIRHTELLNAISASVTSAAAGVSKPFEEFMPSEWEKLPVKKVRKKRMSKAERDFNNSKVHCFLMARAVPAEPKSDT